MSLSRTTASAATIQRIYRGSRSRAGLPHLRRYQAANLSAGRRLDIGQLNTHGFWSTEPLWPEGRPVILKSITFSETTIERDTSGKVATQSTDFRSRQERPLHKVLEMIESGIKGHVIYPHFLNMTKKMAGEVDSIFNEIVSSLSNGQKFYCNDHMSTRIDIQHLRPIQLTWLKFLYFLSLDTAPVTLSELTCCATPKPTPKTTPKHSGLKLVRQGSTKIAGGISIKRVQPTKPIQPIQPIQPVDDLEVRFQRILDLNL